MRALRDQDNGICALAAEALGKMGESADGAIPALLRSLNHLSSEVRRTAAEALGKMGGTAAGAGPALETMTWDEDRGVRSQAIRALGAIGGPTPVSAQRVLTWLQDPDPMVGIGCPTGSPVALRSSQEPLQDAPVIALAPAAELLVRLDFIVGHWTILRSEG
jgi:HEAT repeat protein